MARYDIYRESDRDAYLLEVQADVLDNLNSRVVVPLLPPNLAPVPARHLNPTFAIAGRDYVMVTQFISAMPLSDLHVAAGQLSVHREQIARALDMLFQGF